MKMGVANVWAKRLKTGSAVSICGVLLSGCMGGSDELAGGNASGSGGSTRGVVTNVISAGQEPIKVDPNAFLVDVYCPPIQMRPNTHYIAQFKRGMEDDPAGLLYQATIKEWARSCSRVGTDQTGIKIGISGRATPGPAWEGGDVKLPVRVALLPGRGEPEPLESELLTITVNIPAGTPSETWTFVEEKFTVPRNEDMKIVFGFDEGENKRRR